VSLGQAPDWKRGYWRGRVGGAKPETKGEPNKALLAGYATGRRVFCWELWSRKHGRRAVYDGTAHPAQDPLPSTVLEIDSWLRTHGGSVHGQRHADSD
jgi:hypothetical protein